MSIFKIKMESKLALPKPYEGLIPISEACFRPSLSFVLV